MFKKISLVGVGLILALGVGATAQQMIPPESSLTFVEVWRPATGKGETEIVGKVIDILRAPVAGVKVRLRNLTTGEIEEVVETNDKGEYAFALVKPGTYVVEMVLADGTVVGLSNAGSLARYETMQTVVQLPGRWNSATGDMALTTTMSSFVGMSSALSMTASTMTMAVEQNIKPIATGQPVSPSSP